MAQPHEDRSGPDATPRRGRFRWIKWVSAIALIALLVVEGIYLWPSMSESWRALTEMHWGWAAAAVVAQLLSLSAFAGLLRKVLRAGGVRVSLSRSTSVVYGSTAMAVTLPAGLVFSTAFTYRQTRRWGATPMVASWQLAVSGVVSTAALAAMGAVGAFAVGSSISPVTLLLSITAAGALLIGLRYVAQNPSSIKTFVTWNLERFNRLIRRSADAGIEAFERALSQLEAVHLRRRDMLAAAAWSGLNRVLDMICLGFACWAVGGTPSLAGLIIAFTAAKAVGSVPLAPAGLGFVDGTLIATLTAAGLSASQSLAAVFVYRAVSVVFVAAIGWITVAVLYRGVSAGADIDPVAERTVLQPD
ncbi:YbhN family protein [Rhodococcus sp. F64268]|uniref:lysylphosphatidylglycerol synthase transmembrane domain-containing protein n=1 Tax=Rhodococcus sp. HNM0563 TaxID=2716339 RepID=UPI0027DEAD22|nr:YbhN family protein [Rhodococcus sp. F64268]